MTFKKRSETEEKQTKGTEECSKTKKYSLWVYVTVMFCVVVAVILLSYFMQERNARQIDELTETHGQISAQALGTIERLQDEKEALIEENAALNEELASLGLKYDEDMQELREAWASDVGNVEDTMKTDYNELLQQYGTVRALFDAYMYFEKGDLENAAARLSLVTTTLDSLPGEYIIIYTQLLNELNGGEG